MNSCYDINFEIVFFSGVMGISPGSSGPRLPYLSGIAGQAGMEAIPQPPTTNASPVSAYGMIAPNARTTALHNNLATLAETIAQATSLIQAAGLGQGFFLYSSSMAVTKLKKKR